MFTTRICAFFRDLPLAAAISMLLVIAVYILINIAYFTVLTPLEFIASDAVALVGARKSFLTQAVDASCPNVYLTH